MDQNPNIVRDCEVSVRLSVVSHEQDDLVEQLLVSVARHCHSRHLSVTVTRNIPSPTAFSFEHFPFPVRVLQNFRPKGFGANHNQAFITCKEDYFCVLNPDIVLLSDIFDNLISCFVDPKVGVSAPAIINSKGVLQDNARCFPSPVRILGRSVFQRKEYGPEQQERRGLFYPDWVAGMFMFFSTDIFRQVGGFDEHFFMYCEDADICMRLRQAGYATLLLRDVKAIHDARRNSHKSIRHLGWHLSSLLRFFFRYPFYQL